MDRRRVLAATVGGVAMLALSACGSSGSPSAASPGAGSSTGVAEPVSAPLRAGERFVDLTMPDGGYRPAPRPGSQDDYRCFLMDAAATSATFITGTQFRPGNASILHHAILYRATAAQVPAAEKFDGADGRPGWTCFGGPGLPTTGTDPIADLDSADWLAAWAPGGGESVLADDLGVPLAAGDRVVLQVHYHLHDDVGTRPTDTSSVRLRLVDGTAAKTPLVTSLLAAPVELPCGPGESGPLCDRFAAVGDLQSRFGAQAGARVAGLQFLCGGDPVKPAAGPTQSCDRPVRQAETVRAAAGHMHLLGRSIRIEVNPGTPSARTLLDIPAWNFDDQKAIPLSPPAALKPGDVLRLTCTHDPALRSQLPELRNTAPRYVVWGEGTTDEMCLGILAVTRP